MITKRLPHLIFLFFFTLFCASLVVAANEAPEKKEDLVIEKDKIFDPNILSFDSLQLYEKNFVFDWNNYTTIEPSKKKIAEIEKFLDEHQEKEFSELKPEDQAALGRMLYKLGTYYTHVAREPDNAIKKMLLAEQFLHGKAQKAWNCNHLGYAFEQRFMHTDDSADKEKALFYCNKVISELYPKKDNKATAFAVIVKALVLTDSLDFDGAEENFKKALDVYEKMPGGKNDQYARTKNRLACLILDKNGRDDEAITMLEDLKQYWSKKHKREFNPYAARNLLSLGNAYLKVGKAKEARAEILHAIKMYRSVYGNESELLVEPYQLLADTYKKLGDQKLADAYQIKANMLDKSG